MSAFPLLRSVLVRATENHNKNMLDPAINLLMAFAATASGVLIFATANSPLSEYQLLFGFCFAGGIGGGIVSVLMFPADTLKKTAFKWIASSCSAGLFSPAAIQYFNIQSNIPYVLALSAAIGLFSWGILVVAIPFFGSKGLIVYLLKQFVKRFFGFDLNQEEEEQFNKENYKKNNDEWSSRKRKK